MPDSPNPDLKDIEQDIRDMRGGNVIGEQHNYYTPPSNPAQPRKSGFPWGTLFQVLVAVLGLLLAFLALYPEDNRTELFRSIGLLPIPTATLTPTPVLTETATPTLAPSETPSPTYTETAIPTLTSTATDLPTATILPETPVPTLTNTPPAVPNTQPAIAVPAYPCDGQIVFTTGALLNQVKVTPQRNAPSREPVQQGSDVAILAKQANEGITWYQIRYDNDTKTGWIPAEHVTPSQSCPA